MLYHFQSKGNSLDGYPVAHYAFMINAQRTVIHDRFAGRSMYPLVNLSQLPYISGLKRFFLHIILTIVILDTSPLYQVLKVPSLIRHFTEHQALNHNISFVDFLAMHYWGDDLNDNDDEKDMQLPFKKFEIQQTNFVPLPAPSLFHFKNTSWPSKSHYGPDQPQVQYHAVLGSLFRPPRV